MTIEKFRDWCKYNKSSLVLFFKKRNKLLLVVLLVGQAVAFAFLVSISYVFKGEHGISNAAAILTAIAWFTYTTKKAEQVRLATNARDEAFKSIHQTIDSMDVSIRGRIKFNRNEALDGIDDAKYIIEKLKYDFYGFVDDGKVASRCISLIYVPCDYPKPPIKRNAGGQETESDIFTTSDLRGRLDKYQENVNDHEKWASNFEILEGGAIFWGAALVVFDTEIIETVTWFSLLIGGLWREPLTEISNWPIFA